MKGKARIIQRREQAIKRQEIYNNLTPEQKLELIQLRPGKSKKEKQRLINMLNMIDISSYIDSS